jgi:hypothetical protein
MDVCSAKAVRGVYDSAAMNPFSSGVGTRGPFAGLSYAPVVSSHGHSHNDPRMDAHPPPPEGVVVHVHGRHSCLFSRSPMTLIESPLGIGMAWNE